LPSIRSIDDIPQDSYDSSQEIADYFAYNRTLIIEQKSITTDQANKIQSIIEAYSDEDFYPMFFGERDLNLVLEKFPNGEAVRRKLYVQITKALEGYLNKAKRQIKSTADVFAVDDPCGLVIVLNDKVKSLSPEVVVTRLSQRLHERRSDGSLRYEGIHFVLYVCETHLLDGCIPNSFLIEGPSSGRLQRHREYIDYIVASWAFFCGGNLLRRPFEDAFVGLTEREEPIPQHMSRSRHRELWYKTRPYMRSWSDESVVAAATAYLKEIGPYFSTKGPKLPSEELGARALQFVDFVQEFNFRGLDFREVMKKFVSR